MSKSRLCEIKYGQIYGYLSEDTGTKITNRHPGIVINDERFGTYSFVFTHDKSFKIEGDDKYYFKSEPEMSRTKIKDLNELKLASDYYYEIKNDKYHYTYEQRKEASRIYDSLKIGYVCIHPVEKNISYLEQEVPHFENKNDFDFTFKKTNLKRAITPYEKEEITKNIAKYRSMLKLIEKGLLKNVFYKYDGKYEENKNILEITKTKIPFEERIKLAFEVRNERNFIEKTEKISLIEYVENIKEKYTSEKAQKVFEKIENECKLKEKELKVEVIDNKLSILNELKKEIYVMKDKDEMLDKYIKIRENIAKLENEKENAVKELKDFKDELIEKEKKQENGEKNYEKYYSFEKNEY